MKSIFSFSIHDPINKSSSENEDACIADWHVLAVADGAGGGGLCCGEWANFLVDSIRDQKKPFKDPERFKRWFIKRSQRFYEMQIVNLEKAKAVDLLSKFTNEGSHSTLSVAWINERRKHFRYWGIGDSGIFHFRKADNDYDLIGFLPNEYRLRLDDPPHLLNWQTEPATTFRTVTKSYMAGDTLILATDAMTRMIVRELLQLQKIGVSRLCQSVLFDEAERPTAFLATSTCTLLAQLKGLAKMEETEREETLRQWMGSHILEPDDYTLIFYEIPS